MPSPYYTGILNWLRSNHQCPVCRYSLEIENNSSSAQEITNWVCPLCEMNVQEFSCRCGCQQNVIATADEVASDLFNQIEDLFFKCVDYSRTKIDCDDSNRYESLSKEISSLLINRDMKFLKMTNWDISFGVENLLRSALDTQNEIRFHSGSVGVNSRGLLSILFNRIKTKIKAAYGINNSLAYSGLLALDSNFQLCPLCNIDMSVNDCSFCGFVKSSLEFSLSHKNTTFLSIKNKILEISSLHHSQSLIENDMDFKIKFDAFIEREEMYLLLNGNFKLYKLIYHLLDSIRKNKAPVKFYGIKSVDLNTMGVYAVLINYLINELSSNDQYVFENPYYSSSEHNIILQNGIFPMSSATKIFIEKHYDILLVIANLIVFNGKDLEWVINYFKIFNFDNKNLLLCIYFFHIKFYITEYILPFFEENKYHINKPIYLMRHHKVRDVTRLTESLDQANASFLEVLLGVIQQYETLPSSGEKVLSKLFNLY